MKKIISVTVATLLVAMYIACSDDTVVIPSQTESCTNTTCIPGFVDYPIVYLDVSHDYDPDIMFSRTGSVMCDLSGTSCAGHTWLVATPLDSIYFAYDSALEELCALEPGDTIDGRLEFTPWDEMSDDYLPIAEIYMDDQWDPFWSGVFVGEDIRYLGFRHRRSGKDHYGWVGIKVSKYDATLYISTKCVQLENRSAVAGECY